jgi:hypothetical protein
MPLERLVRGYVLRVAIRRQHWRLTLHDVKTGERLVFTNFAALLEHLETTASHTSGLRD